MGTGSSGPALIRRMTTDGEERLMRDRDNACERKSAQAIVTVKQSSSAPFDDSGGPALSELRLFETFSGDLAGDSPVRALVLRREDGYASQVSLQRFTGVLHGRSGSFVLQGAETVEEDRIEASWFVVPGSGTGELAGLRGDGGFTGKFGEGSTATLDYWFDD